uniref:USP domain-containing protein n=1 Tax=Megaselia scalaris TaxID=36166 RepID=T1GT64_MEGSC
MVKKKRQSDLHEGSSTESSEEMKTSSLAAENLCHHTKKAVDTNRLRKVLKPIGLQKTCSECDKNTTQTNGVGGEHGPDPSPDDEEKKLMYALYGIVEHSGGMYGGHYTAYVKVRPKLSPTDKRWKFLPQGSKAELDQEDEQKQKLEELCARQKARSLRNSMCQDAENDSDDLTTSSSSEPEEIDETEGAVGGQNFNDPENIEPPPGKWYYVSDSRVQEVPESTTSFEIQIKMSLKKCCCFDLKTGTIIIGGLDLVFAILSGLKSLFVKGNNNEYSSPIFELFVVTLCISAAILLLVGVKLERPRYFLFYIILKVIEIVLIGIIIILLLITIVALDEEDIKNNMNMRQYENLRLIFVFTEIFLIAIF